MIFNRKKSKLQEQQRLRLMLDSSPLSCHIWSNKSKIIDCNEAAVKLFGLNSKQDFIERFFSLIPEFQPDGKLSGELAGVHVQRAFEGETTTFEFTHLHADGTLFPTEVTFVSVPYCDEQVVIGYTRDLRKQRELMDMLSEALEHALAASNTKSIFLANISHEIRTPLNAILGMAEIQLQKETLPPNIEEAFNIIYDSGRLLTNIIDDILDFSKIETGNLELSPYIYDITELINKTVNLIRMRFESKPLDFVLKVAENTSLKFFGDEIRIKQVLSNLLSNAFKFTEEGSITLEVFTIGHSEKNKSVKLVFRIIDTGQGISEKDLEIIFDEYTRFNMKDNATIAGAGLGLSITKRLVDLMEGKIAVDSVPGRGSVFTVEIPQERVGTAMIGASFEETYKTERTDYNLKSNKAQFTREYMPYGKVLIVDDVETNLYVAKGLLVPYGLAIDTVSSGQEAIDRVKNGNTYDVIFMDHMMPQLNGMEATKILRDSGYVYPIVALTANAVAGQAEMFLENGFNAFIPKPIDMNELNDVLNELIRDKQPVEIVEAARKENKESIVPAEKIYELSDDVVQAFLRDAKKALAVLDVLYAKLEFGDERDLQLYVTSVHGIKNALEIIGEKDLAAYARDLEQSGRDRNIDLLMRKTPDLLNNIRSLVSKINLNERDNENDEYDADVDLLLEQMKLIREACDNLDKKIIKNALAILRDEVWSQKTTNELNSINAYLLHSAFEKVSAIADGAIQRLV